MFGFSIILFIPVQIPNAFSSHTAPAIGVDGHCLGSSGPGVDYSYCDLSVATLSNTDLNNAILSNAKLAGLDLTGFDFTEADLTNADLSNTILLSVDFVDADLSGADLTNADLSDADLSGANLSGAILTGAILSSCHNHPVCGAQTIGGYLIDIDYTSLFVATLGNNQVITSLVGVTIAGVAGPTIWFISKRKTP